MNPPKFGLSFSFCEEKKIKNEWEKRIFLCRIWWQEIGQWTSEALSKTGLEFDIFVSVDQGKNFVCEVKFWSEVSKNMSGSFLPFVIFVCLKLRTNHLIDRGHLLRGPVILGISWTPWVRRHPHEYLGPENLRSSLQYHSSGSVECKLKPLVHSWIELCLVASVAEVVIELHEDVIKLGSLVSQGSTLGGAERCVRIYTLRSTSNQILFRAVLQISKTFYQLSIAFWLGVLDVQVDTVENCTLEETLLKLGTTIYFHRLELGRGGGGKQRVLFRGTGDGRGNSRRIRV